MKNEKFKNLSELVGENIYTAEEAAEVLSTTRQTVSNMVRDGRLKGVKIGKSLAVTESSLKAIICNLPEVSA